MSRKLDTLGSLLLDLELLTGEADKLAVELRGKRDAVTALTDRIRSEMVRHPMDTVFATARNCYTVSRSLVIVRPILDAHKVVVDSVSMPIPPAEAACGADPELDEALAMPFPDEIAA